MPGYDNELERIVAELNLAAPGLRNNLSEAQRSSASTDQLLAYAARRRASDLLIIAGAAVADRSALFTAPPSPDARSLLFRCFPAGSMRNCGA
jgi:hypothetical protein